MTPEQARSGGYFRSLSHDSEHARVPAMRPGWHLQWLRRQRVQCFKCSASLFFDPDCGMPICEKCLALFHAGVIRHELPRGESETRVLFDRFTETDALTFSGGSPEFILSERRRRAAERRAIKARGRVRAETEMR